MEGKAAKTRPPVVLMTIVLVLVQLVLYFAAFDTWTKERFTMSQGPDHGPPTKVWVFKGADAKRMAAGIAAIALNLTFWTVHLLLRPRGAAKLALLWTGLVLIAAAAVLWFPPWRAPSERVVAIFYGFLAIASVGWFILYRSRGRRFAGIVLGVLAAGVVAVIFGGEKAWAGIMAAGLIFAAGTGHLCFGYEKLWRNLMTKK